MLRTLFIIPHEIYGVPLFGWGWALLLWALITPCVLYLAVRRQGWNSDTRGMLLSACMLAAVLIWVLPWLETRVAGRPIGLPIRGYGAFVLLGTVSGVALAAYRASRVGLDPELIFSLAIWMFVFGFGGARIFFAVQYWELFRRPDLRSTISELLKFTEGGLVVYGALFGGLLAVTLFSWRRQISALALGDLIAPSLLLGLAFGRLGCLMNGCCFGAVCPPSTPLAVRFPVGSPPYVDQLERGLAQGIQLKNGDDDAWTVVSVEPGSAAAKSGLQAGAKIKSIQDLPVTSLSAARRFELLNRPNIRVETVDGQQYQWEIHRLPRASLPVHPAQLYSSLSAATLFLVTLAYYPYRRRDGDVLVLLLGLYAVTRFVEELIRVDEPGRFGTALSIGQWVSVGVLIAAGGLALYLQSRPRGSVLAMYDPAASA